MGVFRNENATARPFRDTQQPGKCSREEIRFSTDSFSAFSAQTL